MSLWRARKCRGDLWDYIEAVTFVDALDIFRARFGVDPWCLEMASASGVIRESR